MIELQINTTQNVNINFIAASVGERIVAYIIDLIIKAAYAIVVYQIGFNIFNIDRILSGMDQWSIIAVIVTLGLPIIFYTLIFELLLDGQTPGKRIMRIKVVKIDGYQASIADYVIRWFFRIVDINMFSGIIALIAIITSPKSQRLGDMTAGTSVISLKNTVTINHTILEELKEDYMPKYPNVIRLSDNDMRIIKDTFIVAKKSRDYETLTKLRTKIMDVVLIKNEDMSDMAFIDTIIKDYNFYTRNM